MVFCSSGLETSVTGSDSVKRKVIAYIEEKYSVTCTSKKSWQELESRDRSIVLRQLNISWSKSFNSWRVIFSEFLIGLLQELRNSPKFPVRGYVQGLLGLAEGQVFLGLNHPCLSRLGKEQETTRFDLFQSKDDFNHQHETLIITGPGIWIKRLRLGLQRNVLLRRDYVSSFYFVVNSLHAITR